MRKLILCLTALLILSGCATTPQQRARNYPEMMASLSPEERQKVEAGEVDVGFTEEMVLVALGEPDQRFEQRTADGLRTIWVYNVSRRRPGVSLGVGAGVGGGRSTSYGGGVSVGSGNRYRIEELYRLIFVDGQVVEIARAAN